MGAAVEAGHKNRIRQGMGVLAILIVVGFVAVAIVILGVVMDVQGLERAVLYRLMKERE
jgi:hypothetical protein